MLSPLALGLFFVAFANVAQAALREYEWTVENEWIAPDGFWRSAYTINGQTPGPPIEAEQGDIIRVHVVNNLNVPITIHWHGLLMKQRPWMDGVPGVTQWPILPKDHFTYEFPVENHGAFWYHSHTVGTYDDGIRGAIVLKPSAEELRPWSAITDDIADVPAIEQAFQNALPMMLYGWSHETAETMLVRWKSSNILPVCFDSILFNGFGRVVCPSASLLQRQGVQQPNQVNVAGQADVIGCRRNFSGNQTQSNPVQCEATTAPFPVWHTSTFASANGRFAAMHLINSGTDASLSFAIDGHDLWIIMIDGQFVVPQRVQVANVLVGSRYTVIIPLSRTAGQYTIRTASSDTHQFQILSGFAVLQVDGQSQRAARSIPGRFMSRSGNVSTNAIESPHVNTSNTTVLDMSLDGRPTSFVPSLPASRSSATEWVQYNGTAINGAQQSLFLGSPPYPANAPPKGPGNLTIKAQTRLGALTWMMSDREFKALHMFQDPILFLPNDNASIVQYLGTVYDAKMGDVVDLIFAASISVDHSLHKHHAPVWIIGSGALVNGSVPFDTVEQGMLSHPEVFNFVDPPLRDVWPLQGGRYVVARFKVDFPAVSLLHCHVDHHMAAGMAIVIREGMDAFSIGSIPSAVTQAAHAPYVRVNATSTVGLDSE